MSTVTFPEFNVIEGVEFVGDYIDIGIMNFN
jgi:hypothetical protein